MTDQAMGKYLLFGGFSYYPEGGWRDLIGRFDDLALIWRRVIVGAEDWFHVVSVARGRMVGIPASVSARREKLIERRQREGARRRHEEHRQCALAQLRAMGAIP